MADKDGKISAAEREAIQNWIESKAPKSGGCEFCGNHKWQLAEHFVRSEIFIPGVTMLGGRFYPNFMLICENCSNTKFFNAALAGLNMGEDK